MAVRWYLRYGLSYRDVEELLAERGVTVDHVTVYRCVQRFTPAFVEAARTCRHIPGGRWLVDETYVKVNGGWTYPYRAVDQFGQVIDVWLSARRDLTAARSFFTRALATGVVPVEVTTDRAPAYPRVLDELVPTAMHTPSGTPTTESRPTMVGSKRGCDRCVASRRSDQLGSSLPVTLLSGTCDAATSTWPPTSQPTVGCRRHS